MLNNICWENKIVLFFLMHLILCTVFQVHVVHVVTFFQAFFREFGTAFLLTLKGALA